MIIVLEIGMVTGFKPQLHLIFPPWPKAVFNAASVQLAAVPFPKRVAFIISAGEIWLAQLLCEKTRNGDAKRKNRKLKNEGCMWKWKKLT